MFRCVCNLRVNVSSLEECQELEWKHHFVEKRGQYSLCVDIFPFAIDLGLDIYKLPVFLVSTKKYSSIVELKIRKIEAI